MTADLLDDKPAEPGEDHRPSVLTSATTPARASAIAALARAHGRGAVEVLGEALAADDPRIKLAAAKEILDRGFGRPPAVAAEAGSPFADYDDAELAVVLALLDAIAGGGEPRPAALLGGGADPNAGEAGGAGDPG